MTTKLSEFYSHRNALLGSGDKSPLSRLAWEAMEEKLIREEILPELLQRMAPVLACVQTPLSLHVDYAPQSKLSVSFSRNAIEVSMPMASRTDAEHVTEEPDAEPQSQEEQQDNHPLQNEPQPTETEPHQRGRRPPSTLTKIRVETPEGKVFFNGTVWFTLRDVILYAGIDRVQSLHQEVSHIPLLADRQSKKYAKSQKEIAPGVFLFTNTNTNKKLAQIKEISDGLGLNLKIEKA